MIDNLNDFDSFESLDDFGEVRPSKTQRKREVEALQALGAGLVKLTKKQLAGLELPLELLKAVQAAQQMPQHEARRRQLQYIGRVMREVDETTHTRIKNYFKTLGR